MEWDPATARRAGIAELGVFSGVRACEAPTAALASAVAISNCAEGQMGGGAVCMPRRLRRPPFNLIAALWIQRRIMRMFCPQPHMIAWNMSPSVPLSGQRARRPSLFMCPITGSMAALRLMPLRSAGVTPFLCPEMKTTGPPTPWPW